MGAPAEGFTENFYLWELRGRGWQVHDRPVLLEPPFRPFPGHVLARKPSRDDARRETFLSTLAARILGRNQEAPPAESAEFEPAPEPEPEAWQSDEFIVEVEVTLPDKVGVSSGLAEALLLSLSSSRYPLSFEILGLPNNLSIRFATRLQDRDRVVYQLRAFLPEAVIAERREGLQTAWENAQGEAAVLELGLGREFMLPLRTFREFRPDPLVSILGALTEVRTEELGLLQVLFTPVVHPWAESVIRAVHTPRGEPFFLDAPELTSLAKEKIAHPLFAAAIRVAAKGGNPERAWALLSSLAGSLAQFADWNELVPLANEEDIDLEGDLLGRTTHRTGFLLSLPELAALVHLPHESVKIPTLRREMPRTKAPPPVALGAGVTLGASLHAGREVAVRLPPDLRMRHFHVVGASGTGKSTLLVRMILEDVEAGHGVGVLDPHGDLIEEVLARMPEERAQDLTVLDPSDEEVSLGWNMLQAHSEIEKTLLASDLVGVFRRLSTSWGDQMNSVLANAVLAILESRTGGTLLDLRRFLVDREFRAEFLRTVDDSEVLYYWQKEFPLLVGKPQGPILTRLDTFLRPKLVRRIVAEERNQIDFRGIVDRGEIFLAKLSQGAIGEENAALLGSLLTSKFHQVAISRQDLAPHARRHFFLYLDECHEFATPSMASLLTGARKYRLGLILAHQELRQLERGGSEVRSALLGNAATRIIFRVGDDDARVLERGLSSFGPEDLVNLGTGEAIGRIERADHDFTLETRPLPELPAASMERRERILQHFRNRFGRREDLPPAAPEPVFTPPEMSPSAPRPLAPPRPEPRPPRERKPAEPRATPPPLGRGGPEHQYLQELVKRWAESHGYRAVVEEEILGGRGKVDVSLRTDDFSMACEISVTSTVAQEVGNVQKCLEAGFHEVTVLGLKRPRLAKIEAALKAKLPAPDLARVHLLSPEELFAMLSMRPVTTETVVGGYKVKVRRVTVDPDEAAARYRALTEVVAKSIRRMGGGEKT